jgi:hypothetical protein
VADITPSTLHENPGSNTAIHTGLEEGRQMLDNDDSGRRRGFNLELNFWCVCAREREREKEKEREKERKRERV